MDKPFPTVAAQGRRDAVFTWNYNAGREGLTALYEKAKQEQWNGATALDWSTAVDPEAEMVPDANIPIYGSELWEALIPREVKRLRRENFAWVFSQFLHGEQGALLATSQIVSTVPWIEGKLFGSTQVVDEGRHVEVFSRYLREKIGKSYPVNANLKGLLDVILTDSRWDMKFLGMQVLIEGLAMGAFALLHAFTQEPLMKSLLSYVMKDESRHVAFGVLSLRDFFRDLPEGERRDREDFAYEGCITMRDRLVAGDVAEEMGMPVERWKDLALQSKTMQEFRTLLFSRIVPNLKRLDLLPDRLRPSYDAIGILHFEDEAPSA